MGTSVNIPAMLPRAVEQEKPASKKPVAAALSAWTPDSVLRNVLSSHKGFASLYDPSNVNVVVSDPTRTALAAKHNAGSGLEFWPSSEAGTTEFPRPANTNGKAVLEIYDQSLARNPQQLQTAIYGDLMHGMVRDPYWKSLRDQFMQSFTPQESKRQQEGKTWWDDVNGSKQKFGPTYDAYIRGWIANEGNGRHGQLQSGNTMYSPRQLQILQEMQNYLTTGEVPGGTKSR